MRYYYKGRNPFFRQVPHFEADQPQISQSSNKNTRQGGKFYPRQLNITWGNDLRYWKLPPPEAGERDNFAELKQVCWLEVTGSTEGINLKRGKSYRVGFKVSLRPDAFGWDECIVYIMAKIGKKGRYSFKNLSLAMEPRAQQFNIPKNDDQLLIKIPNDNSATDDDQRIYFGLYEVWSKRWKGGLRIHYAFVEEIVDNHNQP